MNKTVEDYREAVKELKEIKSHVDACLYLQDRLGEMTDGHEEPPLEDLDTMHYPIAVEVLKDYRQRKLAEKHEDARITHNLRRNNVEQMIKHIQKAIWLITVQLKDIMPKETIQHMENLQETITNLGNEIKQNNEEISEVPF